MNLTFAFRAVVIALMLLVTACGGSGGSSSTTPPSPTYYPRFGFEVNRWDNTVSVYLINAATGQWLHNGYATNYYPNATSPVAVTVTSDEKFVFVANDSGRVTGFSLDSNSGRLLVGENKFVGTNPTALVVAPNNPKFLFVANAGDDNIASFTVNELTGLLSATATPTTDLGVGTAPSAMILHPTLARLYVANSGTGTVSGFEVNTTTGALTPLAGSPYPVGTNPKDLAIDPSGKFLYVANKGSNNVTAYKIDSTTGVLSGMSTATAGSGPSSITVGGGSAYVYAANYSDGTISIFRVDAATGALSPTSTLNPPPASGFLRADPSGNFLFVNNNWLEKQTYRINATNGSLTALSSTRTRGQTFIMSSGTSSLSPEPRYAYVVDSTHAALRSYSVNNNSGALSFLDSYTAGNTPIAVAVDPHSRFVYTVNNADNTLSGYYINDSTGVLTPIDLNASPSSYDLPLGDEDPQHLVVDPSGNFLYVSLTTAAATGRVRAFTVGLTGVLTEIAGSPYDVGVEPKQLSIDPTGQYLLVVNQTSGGAIGFVSSFSIDPVSGELTSRSADLSVGSNPQSIAFEPSGRSAYVGNRDVGNSGTTLTHIHIAPDGLISGSGTLVNTIAGPVDLAMDPLGHFVFVAGAGLPGLAAHEITSSDGTLSSAVTTPTTPTPASIEIDPSGRFAYVGYSNDLNISVYSINNASGSLTAASTTPSADFPLSMAISRRLVSSTSPSGNWR